MNRIAITTMNAGELTPQIDARADVEKYSAGCRILENMIPRIYGSVERRPGTKYINTTKNTPAAVRLIPFSYSSDISYMCEFGAGYIRFYYSDALLLDGDGNAVEVSAPYSLSQLFELHYRQVGDVMWICHKNHRVRKLSRVSATEFSLEPILFENGPFRVRNDLRNDDGITMTYAGATGVGVIGTLTASTDVFDDDHVGALFQLTHPKDRFNIEIAGTLTNYTTDTGIFMKGTITVSTRGTWDATLKVQVKRQNSEWEDFRIYKSESNRNVQESWVEKEDNVRYRFYATSVISGTGANTFGAELTNAEPLQKSVYRIREITDSKTAVVKVVIRPPTTNGLVATLRWAEGSWSNYRGQPSSVDFFDNRCVYGGMEEGLATVWLSKTDDFDNFDAGVDDADSFRVVLPATNDLLWVSALESLMVGTRGDEWRISSSKLDTPITPTNYTFKQQTTHGSETVQPEKVNDAILFADRVSRKLYELTWRDSEQKYTAPDLTALAEHVTDGGITSMAYQRNPDAILWSTRTDGTLLSMSYEREQNVVAWARHLGGITADDGTGAFGSVAVMPGTTEDEVWVSVLRNINGTSTRFIEKMASRVFATQADAFFVDCGIVYSGAATATITGLSHLEGEEVAIWGNGAVYANQTVVGGQITLDQTVTKASVGLPFQYRVKPMRLDVSGGKGTTMGAIKKITKFIINLYKTLGLQYGIEGKMYPIDWRTTEVYGSPPTIYTGQKRLTFDGGFDIEDPIILSGVGPEPCTIRAIVVESDTTG